MHSGMLCVWHAGWQVLTGNILAQRVSPWGVGGTKAKTPSPPFGSAGRRNRHVDNGHWRQERRAQDAAWAPRGRGSLEQASEERRPGRGGGTSWSRPVALC